MINLLRVDGRLVHGMVAVTWVGEIKPNCLIVVNDEAAGDSFHTMTLKLAKPANCEMFVWSREKAVERLNGPKYKNKKILMIVATIEDAEYMVDHVADIRRVNIGPEVDGTAGRVTEGKTEVGGVYISAAKFQCLKRMHEKGAEVFAQITPQVGKADYSEIAKIFE